jgi:hypothetical protein
VTTPIQLDSLSNHRVSAGESVYGYGSGFDGITGVQVGAEWAADFRVDGGTIVTFTVPHGAGGASEWVVLHAADGTTSPCVGDEQRITYVDPLAAPSGPLRLDGISPETITVGRADSYWLIGGGLSAASGVVVGHSGCEYETYDDERLILHVPDQVRVDAGATSVEVKVLSPNGDGTLHVPCIQIADATSAGGAPAVLGVDPTSLPSSGGQLTIRGGGFQEVTWVHVGASTATIQSLHHDTIVVQVDSLADFVGQRLGVEVGNDTYQTYAIDNTDHITVTA